MAALGKLVILAVLALFALPSESSVCTDLHLEGDEKARGVDDIWGGGLIETVLEVDVVVVGGGAAGTSAAIAAARGGASTVLVEGRPVLGGNAGAGVRVQMVGACGGRAGNGGNDLKLDCREAGIVEEYHLDNSFNNPDIVPELFSLEILTLGKAEPNLQIFLNTWLVGANTTSDGKTITSVACENQETQRRYVIHAKQYIDTSGDGRLGAEVGAEWIQGRENKTHFNESLAQDVADHETEGSSILIASVDRGAPRNFRPPFWASKYTKDQFRYRSVGLAHPCGFWWNEVAWPYNTITDGENVTNELIADGLGIWDYVKNSGDHPESANYGLAWIGYTPGKREGRRFRGQFVQTQNDIMADPSLKPAAAPKMYWDNVAVGGWAFDLHNPKGMRDPNNPPFKHYHMPWMYSTSLGSLISKDLTNLFFAGRLASFSHVVYGSQRVMKTCAVMGQAAGTAAAYCVKRGIAPIKLRDNKEAVSEVQQQLLRDDHFIIGVKNEDPLDHARNATVTASSEQDNGKATNVISGQSRAIVWPMGVLPGQGIAGTNRWISNSSLSAALRAALTLSLAKPAAITQVQLIFDSGLHNELAQGVGKKGIWGPQPTVVRDYTIEGKEDGTGKWTVLCNVTGNYQRRRVHKLPCPAAPPTPPTPPPAPAPSVAAGAVTANTCNPASASQLWSIGADGVVSTTSSSGGRLCLSYDPTIKAFGGVNQAVVARPCGASPTQWVWKPTSDGSFLSLPAGVQCASNNFACIAKEADSITIAGASLVGVNGVYQKISQPGKPAFFQLDDDHQLYSFEGGPWQLARLTMNATATASSIGTKPVKEESLAPGKSNGGTVGDGVGGGVGVGSTVGAQSCLALKPPYCSCAGGAGHIRNCSCAKSSTCANSSGATCQICDFPSPPYSQVYYTAKKTGGEGPPASESDWVAGVLGAGHGPTSTTCEGGGAHKQDCQCAHASPCAACHTEKYYPPAAMELWSCDAKATHIRWTQLAIVDGGTAGGGGTTGGVTSKGLLMSGGLCLEVSEAKADGTDAAAATTAAFVPEPMRQRVQMNNESMLVPDEDAVSVSAIRVTVTATNGIKEARINEVRLYENDGVPPFSMRN